MSSPRLKILVIGATGSIGRQVVVEATRRGHDIRAVARDPSRLTPADNLEVVVGDLLRPATLSAAVKDVDAIIFTHGSYGGVSAAEAVDYGGVRNVLAALDGCKPRIALMTAIGVTDRETRHDWKRRAERLVRASGLAYTIVRPGWFDHNGRDQLRLVLLQGDKRHSGTPRDGVISRRQVAEVLVRSLTSPGAANKTFELVAESGPQQADVEGLFAELDGDIPGTIDGVHDAANMALDREPFAVIDDLSRLATPLVYRTLALSQP